MRNRLVWLCLGLGFGALSIRANGPELLSRDILEKIGGELSGKICLEHVRDLSTFRKWYGSRDMMAAARWMDAKLRTFGLSDVRIEQFAVAEDTYYWMQKPWLSWDCRLGELRMLEPERRLVSSFEANDPCVLANSRSGEVTAGVVYVGEGVREEDYEGLDVRGKIVLAYGDPWNVSKVAFFEKDAAALLYGRGLGTPGLRSSDIVQTRLKPWNDDQTKQATFGFSLSADQAQAILKILETGESVVMSARVEADIRLPGFHPGVVATIRGTEWPDEEIILTSHLDHSRPGAHDNNSGCAVLLEAARALRVLIRDGIIPAPKRTIRFYWNPHVWGVDMLLSTHPDLQGRIKANINVDCVGLDQTKVSSALAVIMPPMSQPGFIGDMVRNMLEYVDYGANSQWDRLPADSLRDHDGTANVFHGRVIPFLGYSDHLTFNSASVGIPAVALWDIPFKHHHTQNDELELLDPTPLKRAAFLAASSAYLFAAASAADAPAIMSEIYHRGRGRIEDTIRSARRLLDDGGAESVDRRFGLALDMVRHIFQWETRNLEASQLFGRGDSEAEIVLDAMLMKLRDYEDVCARDIRHHYGLKCSRLGRDPKPPGLSPEEENLRTIIPVPIRSAKGAFGQLNDYPGDKYQLAGDIWPDPPWFYEIFNFMDGRRSLLDIVRTYQAEALICRYPSLSPDEVIRYVEALEQAGVIELIYSKSP